MKTLLLLLCLVTAQAFAQELTADGERLRKFQLALETLNIEPEADPSYEGFPEAGTVNYNEVMSIARYIDPEGGLKRYLSIDPTQVSFYTDFFSPVLATTHLDYDLPFGTGPGRDSEELLARLSLIAGQVQNGDELPLKGFKIVIDPGHMGAPEWDNVDGKFVSYKGKTVREGDLNLSIAKLLAIELEALGAEVILTRTATKQVTPYTLANYDATSQKRIYFYKSLDSWMKKYLALSDSELVATLPNAKEVLKASTAAQRETFFLQEDLNARMNIVDAESPDLFIGLHNDSEKSNALQNAVDDSEVYVPGAIGADETGPRHNRARALKHLLEVRRWKQTVKMAERTVQHVARNLKLPLMNTLRIPSTIMVKEGVFARNLFQTNRADKSLCIFFESFHYDHVKEFPVMAIKDRQSAYHGAQFTYPGRLEGVANGIRDGILTYFREYSEE